MWLGDRDYLLHIHCDAYRWSSENKGADIIMLSLQDNLGLIYRQAMLVILRGGWAGYRQQGSTAD